MSTPYETDAPNLRHLAAKIGEVETDLDYLRDEVERTNREHSDDLAEHQRRMDEHGYDIEQLQETVSGLETELASATKQLAKIADRYTWLERHIRASDSVRIADFDTLPTSLHDVIIAVRRGRSLAAQLLDNQVRHSLEWTIEQAASRQKKIDDLTETALATNKVLVSTSYDTTEHLAAADQFRTVYAELKRLVEEHSKYVAAVESAHTKLAAANNFRDTNAPAITTGKEAERGLRTRMRTMVVNAIGEGALPPVWFSTALGVAAPQNGTDYWIDLAADVLTHRAVYDITDPVLALGPEPSATATGERAAHRRLTQRLHNL